MGKATSNGTNQRWATNRLHTVRGESGSFPTTYHSPLTNSSFQSLVISRAADAAEDHPARRSLQHARDGDRHFLADRLASLLHDDHGPVVKITDPLADLIALLDDPHV